MAIKTISQFPSSVPAKNDYILFEQNGEGKHTTIGDAVNTCSLTYEEIMATNPVPDLTNKIASASALQQIGGRILTGHSFFPVVTETGHQNITVTFDTPLPSVPKAVFLTWWDAPAVVNYCDGLNVIQDKVTKNSFMVNTLRLKVEYVWNFSWMVVY